MQGQVEGMERAGIGAEDGGDRKEMELDDGPQKGPSPLETEERSEVLPHAKQHPLDVVGEEIGRQGLAMDQG